MSTESDQAQSRDSHDKVIVKRTVISGSALAIVAVVLVVWMLKPQPTIPGPEPPPPPPPGAALDDTEVTNTAYREFVLANPVWQKSAIPPSAHDGDYLQLWTGNDYPPGLASHPVVFVTWYAADAYCRWKGERLPSEAEWESAARAGTTTAYWWGETFDPDRANGNSGRSVPVGSEAHRNALGLADMLGNVWEWTASTAGDRNVVRGGSWKDASVVQMGASARVTLAPTITGPDLGFRCAR